MLRVMRKQRRGLTGPDTVLWSLLQFLTFISIE